jgi:tryptophanyl-tRNA synthetase
MTEVRYDDTATPGVSGLLDILAAATGTTVEHAAMGYSQYGPLKSDTGEAVVAMLEPIQRRYRELIDDRAELGRMLRQGADRARSVASVTLERAYGAIGMLPA